MLRLQFQYQNCSLHAVTKRKLFSFDVGREVILSGALIRFFKSFLTAALEDSIDTDEATIATLSNQDKMLLFPFKPHLGLTQGERLPQVPLDWSLDKTPRIWYKRQGELVVCTSVSDSQESS
jgi:hypothetical protein